VKIPHLTPVQSKNIQAMGHEGTTLWIRFKGGGLYSYDGVPAETYHEGVAADSVGGWFHSKIRGAFAHRKHDA
jgi:hypothetical protein